MKSFFKKLFFNILPNSTEVIITPGGARWGNLLYFFLRAYIFEQKGKTLRLLYTEHMADLLLYFPGLKKYVIEEKEVKFYHKKDSSNQFYQVFGEDFVENQLNEFIREHLLSSQFVKAFLNQLPEPDADELTINIRRGDFYEKGNSSIYGYDQIEFIKHIFDNYFKNKNWKQINILSDDMNWCQDNFKFLEERTHRLHYPDLKEDKAISSFLWVAKSKNLVLSNSTFSFWAAYISNDLYQSQDNTFCPIFGSRRIENTDLYQYNPKWVMVRDFNFDLK